MITSLRVILSIVLVIMIAAWIDRFVEIVKDCKDNFEIRWKMRWLEWSLKRSVNKLNRVEEKLKKLENEEKNK